MMKYFLVYLGFAPSILLAQKAPNTLPQDNKVKDTARQTDIIDIGKNIFHIKIKPMKEEKEKTVYFTFLPFGSAPGGDGKALVTSTTAGMYLGPKSNTNKSTLSFAPYLNFRGRFGIPFRSNVWLPKNKIYIYGDVRFLVYPQNTWGLGTSHPIDESTLVDYRYIRFYQTALKRIKPRLYAGIGYQLDYHTNIKSDDTSVNLKTFTGYQYGTEGHSFSSGITFNLLYDTRNHPYSALPGFFANIVYRANPVFLGNSRSWNSLLVDLRKYIALNPASRNQQNTLAFWSYFWTVLNNGTPYLDLPTTGWDAYNRSARGIDQNRYRGKTLFYLESEYRRDITSDGLLGFVVFGNINTVSGSGTFFTSWHPAAGAGLRIKGNKADNTNISIDFAFSNGYRTYFLNLSEAF